MKMDEMPISLVYIEQTRNASLGLAAILSIWLVYVLVLAYRRYRGTPRAPVPIDYKQQKLKAVEQ